MVIQLLLEILSPDYLSRLITLCLVQPIVNAIAYFFSVGWALGQV